MARLGPLPHMGLLLHICFGLAVVATLFGIIFLVGPVPGPGYRRVSFLICVVLADICLVTPFALCEAGDEVVGAFLVPYDVATFILFEGRIDTFHDLFLEAGAAESVQFTRAYLALMQTLYVVTPIAAAFAAYAAFTQLLKNFSLKFHVWQYRHRPGARIYLFEGMNDRSIVFVKNLFEHDDVTETRKYHGKRLCVFAGVSREDRERESTMVDRFYRYPVLFTDLDSVEVLSMLEHHSRSPIRAIESLHVFFFGDEEGKNLSDAIRLIERLVKMVPLVESDDELTRTAARFAGGEPRYHVYCACRGISDELTFDSIEGTQGFDVRVVDETREVIYDLLFDFPLYSTLTCSPERLIEAATDLAAPNRRLEDAARVSEPAYLTVLIIGCGRYGLEALKACVWSGQIPGVVLRIHVIDGKPEHDMMMSIGRKCPELLGGGLFEFYYHEARVDDLEFIQALHIVRDGESGAGGAMTQATPPLPLQTRPYVIVTLGDDDLNTDTALAVRKFFYGDGTRPIIEPDIHVNVYDERRHETVSNLRSVDGAGSLPYAIDPFGGIGHIFSEEHLVDSAIEKLAYNANASYWGMFEPGCPTPTGRAFEDAKQMLFLGYSAWQMNRLSSVANAIGIRTKMWVLGFDFVDGPGSESAASHLEAVLRSFASPIEDPAAALAFDAMTRKEHDRWMGFYLAEGWRDISPAATHAFKELGLNNGRHDSHFLMRHPFLCPFDELLPRAEELVRNGDYDDVEKVVKYDQDFIRNVQAILSDKCGFTGRSFGIVEVDPARDFLEKVGRPYRMVPGFDDTVAAKELADGAPSAGDGPGSIVVAALAPDGMDSASRFLMCNGEVSPCPESDTDECGHGAGDMLVMGLSPHAGSVEGPVWDVKVGNGKVESFGISDEPAWTVDGRVFARMYEPAPIVSVRR